MKKAYQTPKAEILGNAKDLIIASDAALVHQELKKANWVNSLVGNNTGQRFFYLTKMSSVNSTLLFAT